MWKHSPGNLSWPERFGRVSMAFIFLGISVTARSDDEAQAEGKRADKSALVPLNKKQTVLLDVHGGRLLLKTKVCLREGVLEMLCCRKHSKEHESILSLDARAYVVHTGLLALKAKPGKPVQFSPKYQPPTGQLVDIFLQWKDAQGRLQRVDAQTWIRHATRRYFVHKLKRYPSDLRLPKNSELKYDDKTQELYWYGPLSQQQRDELLKLSKSAEYQTAIKNFHLQGQVRGMRAKWVFAGSGFSKDQETGEKFYQAEGGDVICVANFASALIDVATASSAAGTGSLLFEAFEQRIPAVGTDVTVELIPRKKTSTPKKKPAAESKTQP
jgi:hypothetical protein